MDSFGTQSKISATLLAGAVAAGAVAARGCAARAECVAAGTCVGAAVCSFENRVSVAGSNAFNLSMSSDALALELRGVCAPGERLQTSTITHQTECVPYFGFPSALDTEIMDAGATEPHRRACAKWIDAKSMAFAAAPEQRSLVDQESWQQVLLNAENASTLSSRNAKDQMSKFRAECRRTVDSGTSAVHVSSGLAYKEVRAVVEAASTRSLFLRAVGHLVGRYCHAPVQTSTYLNTDGRFYLAVSNGWLFSDGVLQDVLALFDEAVDVQRAAESANAAVNTVARAYEAASLSAADVQEMLRGAVDDASGDYRIGSWTTDYLDSLMQLYSTEPEKATAYLKGTAAYCVYSVMSNVQPQEGVLAQETNLIKQSRPPAAALGRLRALADHDVQLDSVRKVSEITLTTASGVSSGNADLDCLSLMRVLFADAVDEARFRATMPDSLYSRLQNIVLQARIGVSSAVMAEPLRSVLADPDAVAAAVGTAGVRIAGAPRGTWAGIARALPDAQLSGDDGLFKMALKQSHAVFVDRVSGLVLQNADACDHPPISSAVSANAYTVTKTNCVVHFLGLAHRPWLDAQYDDVSLASRGGAAFAHEMAHLTLNSQYNYPQYEDLLTLYQPSTYSEAVADVGAALGMVSTGLVTRDQFLENWCQIWCSRVPALWAANESAVHPEFNQRCDFLDATVRRYI